VKAAESLDKCRAGFRFRGLKAHGQRPDPWADVTRVQLLRRPHRHRQAGQGAQCVVVAPADQAGDLDRAGLARQGGEYAIAFEPRQELADALMDAAAEADMADDAAGDGL